MPPASVMSSAPAARSQGLSAGFEEAVITSGRCPCQVQRGSAGAAQARALLHDVLEDAQVGVHVLHIGIGEAGGDQAVGHFFAFADADALVVEVGAATAGGGEQVVFGRVVDNCLSQHAIMLQADGNGILRNAMQEIGGAIQRIDDPDVFRLALGAALFC